MLGSLADRPGCQSLMTLEVIDRPDSVQRVAQEDYGGDQDILHLGYWQDGIVAGYSINSRVAADEIYNLLRGDARVRHFAVESRPSITKIIFEHVVNR